MRYEYSLNGMGWRSLAFEPADGEKGVKPPLTPEAPIKSWAANSSFIVRLLILVTVIFFLVHETVAWSYGYAISESEDGFYICGAAGLNYRWSYGLLIKIDKNGNELWNKTYEGIYRSQIWRCLKSEDGLFLGGVTGFNDDAWIAKVDFDGNMSWQKVYGYGSDADSASCISEDLRGVLGFLTIAPCQNVSKNANTFNLNCPNVDTWILHLDEKGNELWVKKIDFRDYDSIKSAKKVRDGYIAAGVVGDFLGDRFGNYDIWVLKIDEMGNVVWSKFFNLGYDEFAWDVIEFEEGYVVVGSALNIDLSKIGLQRVEGNESENLTVQASHGFALKLDSSGNLEWVRFFDDGLLSTAWSAFDYKNKLVIAGAGMDKSGSFIWFRALDGYGENVWLKTYRNNFNFFLPYSGPVQALKVEDGYLVVGSVGSVFSSSCPWVGKFNKDGEIIWERAYCLSENQHNFKFANQDSKDQENFIGIIAFGTIFLLLVAYLIKKNKI
jgi:hypothetical protein